MQNATSASIAKTVAMYGYRAAVWSHEEGSIVIQKRTDDPALLQSAIDAVESCEIRIYAREDDGTETKLGHIWYCEGITDFVGDSKAFQHIIKMSES